MPVPLIALGIGAMLAGGTALAVRDQQNRMNEARNKYHQGLGNINYRQYEQTEDGINVANRSLAMPNGLRDRAWVGESEANYANYLTNQVNKINEKPLTYEQQQEILRKVQAGNSGGDAIRQAIGGLSEVQGEAYKKSLFNAAQERSQMYERLMAEDASQVMKAISAHSASYQPMRYFR